MQLGFEDPYIKRAHIKSAPYVKKCAHYVKKCAPYVMKRAPYVMKSTYQVKLNQQLWQLWHSILESFNNFLSTSWNKVLNAECE